MKRNYALFDVPIAIRQVFGAAIILFAGTLLFSLVATVASQLRIESDGAIVIALVATIPGVIWCHYWLYKRESEQVRRKLTVEVEEEIAALADELQFLIQELYQLRNSTITLQNDASTMKKDVNRMIIDTINLKKQAEGKARRELMQEIDTVYAEVRVLYRNVSQVDEKASQMQTEIEQHLEEAQERKESVRELRSFVENAKEALPSIDTQQEKKHDLQGRLHAARAQI